MTVPAALEILTMAFGGKKNFFTDRVLKTGKAGPYRAWELSTGEGLFGKQLWGVTVVDYDRKTETTQRSGLSKAFLSHAEASVYIEALERKV